MSEKQKSTQKSLSERVSDYFLMKEALEKKYEQLIQEVAEIHDPNAKQQVYSGFSYIAPALINDEPMLVNNFLLQNRDAEAQQIEITELKLTAKRKEDALVKDALGWFMSNGLEMPKKPRKGYLKLNKRGMKLNDD